MKMIVAMSQDGVIGIDGHLPWTLPSELKLFKHYTKGKTVIMGRKTFESLPGGPLKGRTNVVVSQSMDRDTRVVTERLVSRVGRYKDSMIIGGARLYEYALEHDLVDHIYLTVVDKECRETGSPLTLFPWDWEKLKSKYKWTTRTHFRAREGDECGYTLYNMVKKEAE